MTRTRQRARQTGGRLSSALLLCGALVAVGSLAALAPARPAPSYRPNLVPNAALSSLDAHGAPVGWRTGQWGSLRATFSLDQSSREGQYELHVKVGEYVNGDAKWYFEPVDAAPSASYVFNDYYRATSSTETIVQFIDACGRETYQRLGANPESSEWRSSTYTFITPAQARRLTVFHLLAAPGELWTTNTSLKSINAAKAPTSSSGVGTDAVAPLRSGIPAKRQPPPPDRLIPNGSAETADSPDPSRPTGWEPNSWGHNKARLRYSADGHSGGRSLLTLIDDYVDGDAKWAFDPIPVVGGAQYMFSDFYKSTTVSHVVAAITTESGDIDYIDLPDARSQTEWTVYKSVVLLPPGAVSLTVYHLLSDRGALETDDYALAPHAPQSFDRALVSLTFDDAWRSIYTNGLPLLYKYGLPSTQYLLPGKVDDPEYMTAPMMRAFADQGSELASHTMTHPHLTQASTECFDEQLHESQVLLQQWFGPSAATNFAPPYGEFDSRVLGEVQRFYRSNRSTDVGYNQKDSFDVHDLKVQNVVRTTTPTDIDGWVRQALADRSWLILVYHEVSDAPADAQYAVSPGNLDAELQIIQSSGIAVKTVSQALDELLPQV
jgi:peptidoglycan/xylan/chitin deacetylase (PgdA/CDA1 family)